MYVTDPYHVEVNVNPTFLQELLNTLAEKGFHSKHIIVNPGGTYTVVFYRMSRSP